MAYKFRNVGRIPLKNGEWHIKHGVYRINEKGILRIKNHWQNRHRSEILIPSVIDATRRSYYKMWCVDKNGKEKRFSIPVALLIAAAFMPREADDDWKVNFKDGDIANFNLDNLEWAKRTVKESDIVDDSEQTAERQPEAEPAPSAEPEAPAEEEAPKHIEVEWLQDFMFGFTYFSIRYAILNTRLQEINEMLVRRNDYSRRLFNEKGVFPNTHKVLVPFMLRPGDHVYKQLTFETSIEMDVARTIMVPDLNEILILLK